MNPNTALTLAAPTVLATSSGGLFRGKFRMRFARIDLTTDRLQIHERNRWLASMGLLGFLLARWLAPKLVVDLPLAQIATLARGKFGLNKKILDLTATDGASYRLTITDYDAFTARLREQIALQARLLDDGEERWRVLAA